MRRVRPPPAAAAATFSRGGKNVRRGGRLAGDGGGAGDGTGSGAGVAGYPPEGSCPSGPSTDSVDLSPDPPIKNILLVLRLLVLRLLVLRLLVLRLCFGRLLVLRFILRLVLRCIVLCLYLDLGIVII